MQRRGEEEEPILPHAQVVDAVDVEYWRLALRLLHQLAQEDLGRVLGHVATIVLVHYRVPVRGQDEELRNHPRPRHSGGPGYL